jgi:FHS family L-fucose permease-like MFS transporter
LLPLLQGWVADKMGIQFSFVVPIGAFAYIAFYGLYGYRAGRRMDSKPVTTSTAAATMEGKAP